MMSRADLRPPGLACRYPRSLSIQTLFPIFTVWVNIYDSFSKHISKIGVFFVGQILKICKGESRCLVRSAGGLSFFLDIPSPEINTATTCWLAFHSPISMPATCQRHTSWQFQSRSSVPRSHRMRGILLGTVELLGLGRTAEPQSDPRCKT